MDVDLKIGVENEPVADTDAVCEQQLSELQTDVAEGELNLVREGTESLNDHHEGELDKEEVHVAALGGVEIFMPMGKPTEVKKGRELEQDTLKGTECISNARQNAQVNELYYSLSLPWLLNWFPRPTVKLKFVAQRDDELYEEWGSHESHEEGKLQPISSITDLQSYKLSSYQKSASYRAVENSDAELERIVVPPRFIVGKLDVISPISAYYCVSLWMLIWCPKPMVKMKREEVVLEVWSHDSLMARNNINLSGTHGCLASNWLTMEVKRELHKEQQLDLDKRRLQRVMRGLCDDECYGVFKFGENAAMLQLCGFSKPMKEPNMGIDMEFEPEADEAGRMLDMGFEPEVRSILSQTCSVRQMVMFSSATWSPAVHQLAQEFMDPNPIKVVVASEDLAANHDVMQIVEVLDERAHDEGLQNLLEKYHKSRKNRVLVFVLYKKEESRVESMLHRRGWKATTEDYVHSTFALEELLQFQTKQASKHFGKVEEMASSSIYRSLKRLPVRDPKPLVKMKFMVVLVDGCRVVKGGGMVVVTHMHVHGEVTCGNLGMQFSLDEERLSSHESQETEVMEVNGTDIGWLVSVLFHKPSVKMKVWKDKTREAWLYDSLWTRNLKGEGLLRSYEEDTKAREKRAKRQPSISSVVACMTLNISELTFFSLQ